MPRETASRSESDRPSDRPRKRQEIMPLVAFGARLARRGVMPVLAMVICAGTTAILAILAVVLASRSENAPVHDIPILASAALAWGGGFLHAFATAAHALRKDRAEGIRDLLTLRTMSRRAYLVSRVGGLAALLMVSVGGGTLVCGLVSILAAGRLSVAARTLQSTLAGIAFAIAFAAVVAPVAFAAVGARSRVGGYLFLVGILIFPELFANALSHVLPTVVTEVIAIPSALDALRTGLSPGSFDALRVARALVALSVFAALAMFLAQREVILLEEPEVEA